MRSNKGLISIIVPVYNIERYIGTCIESIMEQTYENLEIILVNDGSPDRCPEICDLYATKDSRIKVIHKKNGGLVSARKAGMQAAVGEYAGYVDGDDWIETDFYQELIKAMEETGADAVVSGYTRDFFGIEEKFINKVATGLYSDNALDDLFSNFISTGTFYNPGIFTYSWNKLFRKDIIYPHQMTVDDEITIGEDAACVYPALLSCNRIFVSNNCSYHYRQREDSMLKLSEPYDKESPSLSLLYKKLLEYAGDNLDKYNIRQQIEDYVLSLFIIRSGGILHTDNKEIKNYPFGKDYKRERIVIYSAGTFGQQIVNRIREQSYCKIVNWLDPDYKHYRRCCLDVNPVESLAECTFDYILIATTDGVLATQIRNELISSGIPEMTILTVCDNIDIRSQAFAEYLSNAMKEET